MIDNEYNRFLVNTRDYFKDKIIMLEMPKKGAVGLREALSGAIAIISGEKEARLQQFQ